MAVEEMQEYSSGEDPAQGNIGMTIFDRTIGTLDGHHGKIRSIRERLAIRYHDERTLEQHEKDNTFQYMVLQV